MKTPEIDHEEERADLEAAFADPVPSLRVVDDEHGGGVNPTPTSESEAFESTRGADPGELESGVDARVIKEAVHNVPAYVPHELKVRIGTVTRQRGMELTALVLEAFETQGSNWHHLSARPSRPGGPPRRVSARGKDSVQVQLRLDGPQDRWLAQQVAAHGAPSRSALVTAVLTKHMGE